MDKLKTNLNVSCFLSINSFLVTLIYFKVRKKLIGFNSTLLYFLALIKKGLKFTNIFESIKNVLKLNQFALLMVVLYFNDSFLFNPINKEE
tara:strand:- start:236 stop:508 length:273 start_codon:yes stop_codon:yes gene_type:complete